MAHIYLLGVGLDRPAFGSWILPLLLVIHMASSALASDQVQHQQRINTALRSVLKLVDSGESFLTYDRAAGELRLQQQDALLRVSPVLEEFRAGPGKDGPVVEHQLTLHLRRYRRVHAYASMLSSPFDWEQYLATDGKETCMLYFSSGLVVYSSAEWGSQHSPSLRLAAADLRALYNTLSEGARLVVLPSGWDKLAPAHGR